MSVRDHTGKFRTERIDGNLATASDKRKKIEKLVYATFNAMDPTGYNTSIWKKKFSKMSDAQFSTFMKQLESDKEFIRYEYHEFTDDAPTLDNAIDASKVIGFDLFQYCYLPHITEDDSVVMRTPTKCLVGWINIKPVQQFVEKKNGSSTSVNIRDPKTGQVTSEDKNAGSSDAEASMILAFMDNDEESAIIKELHGFRSDDFVAKAEAYEMIANTGSCSLKDITTTDNTGKQTLRLVDTYLLGCMIKSDIVTDSYILPSSIGKK